MLAQLRMLKQGLQDAYIFCVRGALFGRCGFILNRRPLLSARSLRTPKRF